MMKKNTPTFAFFKDLETLDIYGFLYINCYK
jgi:hypothetical protein